jgi:membrane-associated protein
VLARFGSYHRTLVPFLAGAARTPYRRFVAASVAGSALWAVVLCLAGYVCFDSVMLRRGRLTGFGNWRRGDI